MTANHERTRTTDQNKVTAPSEFSVRHLAGAALLLAGLAVVLALGGSASASDDTCPNGYYEVNASLSADAPASCQWMAIQTVLSLPGIVPSDVIVIRNGTYNISWNLTTDGISLIGDSTSGVILDGLAVGPALRLAASDTNLTNLTLRTNSGSALALNAGMLRTAIRGVSVTHAGAAVPGIDLRGTSVFIRNVAVSTSPGANFTGSLYDVDGLTITSAAAGGAYKLFTTVTSSAFANITLQGSAATAGLNVSAGSNNVAFTNLFSENATYTVVQDTAFSASYRNIILQNFATVGFYQFGVLGSSAVVDGATIVGAGTYGLAINDGDLTLTNSSVRNAPTGVYHAGNVLTMANVTFSGNSVVAVRKNADGGPILWDGGSVTGSAAGVTTSAPNAGTQSNHRFANITFTNITNAAIGLTPSGAVAWSNVTVVDCRVQNAGSGLALGGSAARPDTAFVIARNTFTNLSNTAFAGFITQAWVTDNVMVAVRNGINIELAGTDLPQNWNAVTTTNTIDGHPVYYLLNVTDVVIPAGAGQIFLINVSNVTASGVAQTSAWYGVNGVLARNVAITDSSVMGNGSFGLYFRNSSALTLRNVTVPLSLAAVVFDNVTGASVDTVAGPTANVLQLFYSQRITIANLSDGGAWSRTLLLVRNSALVTADGITAAFVEATSNAIVVDLSNTVTVRDVTFTGGFRGAYVTNSQDVTFQDFALNNTRVGFDLQMATRTLIERTNVSSNLTAYNIVQSPFTTIRSAYASTFGNPITFDRSPDGLVIDILVAGRTPARGVYADQSDRFRASNVTVGFPGIIAFHLGTLSNALADRLTLTSGPNAASGGRGVDLNLVFGSTFSNLRIDGFDYGIYVTFSSTNVTRAAVTNAGIDGFYNGNFATVDIRDSSFASFLGPGAYFNSPSSANLFHSDFASERSWGARFVNADGATAIECNFTSGLVAAALFEATSNNFSIRHSNFYGTGIDNPGGQGSWDGGFPAGGNFYSWAAPTLLDRLTGPSQNTAGYDGLADSAYDVGGAGVSFDYFPLMDPWPPGAWLTSPMNGSLIRPGTAINFSVSNYFSFVDWLTDTGEAGSVVYPHDVDTSLWADGVVTITIVAYDLYAPTASVVATFTVDGTPPVVTAFPTLGTGAFARGAAIQLTASDSHFLRMDALLDGALLTGSSITVSTAGLGDGLHTLAITATDTVGNVFSYLWTFNVDATAPSLSFVEPGSPIFVRPGDILHYDAQDDSGIFLANYTAVPVGGGTARTGSLAAGGANRALSTSGWSDGCYDLTVTVRDDVGLETSVTRVVCVDGTEPDVSGIADPYFVDEDAPFVMPGAAVSDLDDELVFSWAVGVAGGAVTLDGVSPTFVFVDPGNFTVILTVHDRLANIAQRSFTVVVADLTDPTADFTIPTEWPEDVALGLNGSGASDNSGAPLTYLWSSTGPSGFDTAAGTSPFMTFATPGLHTVTLKVTDRSGNNASVARQVLIKDTTAPTLVVTGASAAVNQGAVMRLDATGSTDNDPSSAVTVVWRFTQGGTPISRIGATLDYTFDAPGAYSINVTATDASGNAAFATLAIHVNGAPRITRGPVGSAVEGVHITWPLTATDADAGDHVTLRLVSGPAGMSVLNNELVWTPPLASAGVYTVVIEASDGSAFANFTYDVQVNPAAGATTSAGDATGLWILLLLVAAAVALVLGRRMGAGKRHDNDEDARTLDPALNPPTAWRGGRRDDFSEVGEASASLTATQAEGEADAGVGSQAEGRPRGGRRARGQAPPTEGSRASLRGESSEGELADDHE